MFIADLAVEHLNWSGMHGIADTRIAIAVEGLGSFWFQNWQNIFSDFRGYSKNLEVNLGNNCVEANIWQPHNVIYLFIYLSFLFFFGGSDDSHMDLALCIWPQA